MSLAVWGRTVQEGEGGSKNVARWLWQSLWAEDGASCLPASGRQRLWIGDGALPISSKCFNNAPPQWLVFFKRNNIAFYNVFFSSCLDIVYMPHNEVAIQELLDLLSEYRTTNLENSGQKSILRAEVLGLVVFIDTLIWLFPVAPLPWPCANPGFSAVRRNDGINLGDWPVLYAPLILSTRR